jgi:hypothetical protein
MIERAGRFLLWCLVSESLFRNCIIPIAASSLMILSKNLKWVFPFVLTICLIVLLIRARTILKILRNGIEVQGAYIDYERDPRSKGNRITYSFSYNGNVYQAVSRSLDRAVPFEKGQKLTVIVNSLNPDLSLIKDLYVKRSR